MSSQRRLETTEDSYFRSGERPMRLIFHPLNLCSEDFPNSAIAAHALSPVPKRFPPPDHGMPLTHHTVHHSPVQT